MLIFGICLPLKEPLAVTLHAQKICCCSRYGAFKVIRKTQITLVTLINWCFRIKASFLRFFLPIRKPLVAKSSERCALASPKDIVKQGMKISKVWEIHKLLWSKFSVYAPKNSLLNVKLGKIFTSAITNGGYLQWKEYNCYKKICTERRH